MTAPADTLEAALYSLKEDAAFAWKQSLEGGRDGLEPLKRSMARVQVFLMNAPKGTTQC